MSIDKYSNYDLSNAILDFNNGISSEATAEKLLPYILSDYSWNSLNSQVVSDSQLSHRKYNTLTSILSKHKYVKEMSVRHPDIKVSTYADFLTRYKVHQYYTHTARINNPYKTEGLFEHFLKLCLNLDLHEYYEELLNVKNEWNDLKK